ncbi:MAG TPA: DNA gyrase inhibitor YacG [Usitatibacter sp.]|nr:DNA gyrase inhibitor YacG [Usitatibacter sp.]
MGRDEPPPPPGGFRTVICPACGKKCAFEPWNPWRPFCSERCRTSDLGAWASGTYRIPGKPGGNDPTGGGPEPEG